MKVTVVAEGNVTLLPKSWNLRNKYLIMKSNYISPLCRALRVAKGNVSFDLHNNLEAGRRYINTMEIC